MKHIIKTIAFSLVVLLVLPIFMVSAAPEVSEKKELRGVWIANVLNIDYPSKPTTDAETLKNEALEVLDNAKYMGLNAVFLQVRPSSDAIYKSKYFPWSKYLTGSQGLAPDGDFDPLQFWIDEAHKRGIELHAWINPYRITKKTSKEKNYDYDSLSASNPAIANRNWVVEYSDGNLYYDPGIPEVRKLVIDGVLEIVENYDIDGIHFDDYFYPGKNFNDKASYEKYGTGYKNINDWRRENVNSLIKDLSKEIKTFSKDVRFGVSPFGIWANKGSNSLGSDTRGLQSYYDQFADTRKWVKDGLIDYIAPQLYWNIGYSIADYSKLVDWWEDVVSGTNVDLYIGQAAYRSGSSETSSPWYGVAEIEKQLRLNKESSGVNGNIFFSYKSLKDNPALSAAIKAIYEQQDGTAESASLNIAKPSGDIKTSLSKFYINGISDPDKPLFLNGKQVDDRSSKGFFGILVTLKEGVNVFTFSQEGTYVTRVIYRKSDSSMSVKMDKAQILSSSVFPQAQEYRSPGEKVTLSCQAPVGSKVAVKINGKTYAMKASGKKISKAGLYPDKYTYTYTIPSYSGKPRNIDLGTPIYTMNYNGIVKTCKAPAKVGVIMKNSPFYVQVEKDVIFTYQSLDLSKGGAFELYKGMVDYITGMTGDYIRLSSGQWVSKSGVRVYTSQNQLASRIESADYIPGESWDNVKFAISSSAAAMASFDGTSLRLSASSVSKAALPKLPEESLFSSVSATINDNKAQYIFKLKNDAHIHGYYILKTPEGFELNIKRLVKAKDGNEPLDGISIMLDPGHGGSDTGATGPLGIKYAEKSINLNVALKLQQELERLGAKVIMTRSDDKRVSLEDRLAASRNEKPDMFISVHSNSMNDDVDISKVDGFSVFYREKLAQSLSQAVLDDTTINLNRNSKGIHSRNFYVIRGTWTPSILIECGFVPNPYEFEWLTDDIEQSNFAKSLSQSIVKYFKN